MDEVPFGTADALFCASMLGLGWALAALIVALVEALAWWGA